MNRNWYVNNCNIYNLFHRYDNKAVFYNSDRIGSKSLAYYRPIQNLFNQYASQALAGHYFGPEKVKIVGGLKGVLLRNFSDYLSSLSSDGS